MTEFFSQQRIDEIRECFNVYCQEGQIRSAAQLRCVLRSLGHSSTSAKTQQYFKNSKKPIDFATFLGIVKEEEESGDALTEVIKALKGLDRSGARAISSQELRAILSSVGERMSHQEIDYILEQMDELISILRVGSVQNVRKILQLRALPPPAEVFLPFVLKKCLQQEKLEKKDISYAKNCFKLFSKLSCLNEGDREKAQHLHRLALVLEAVWALHNGKNYLEAGPDVMTIFKEFMDQYKHEKEAKHFTYFAMICNRRSRFIRFKQESFKMVTNLEKRLKRRALPLLDEFITRM